MISNIERVILECMGSELTFPFDEHTRVYKVENKMFALCPNDFSTISLKNKPDKNYMLRQMYPEIVGGYHLNKEHWITIDLINFDNLELACELIRESHSCVIAGLPKKVREKYLVEKI